MLWPARALYVGPSFPVTAHRNAVAVLALGLDAPLRVARDPDRPGAGALVCRSALIAPNTRHRLHVAGACAFLYVDAASRDREVLRASCAARARGLDHGLANEVRLCEALRGVARAPAAAVDAALDALMQVLPLAPAAAVDTRVAAVAQCLLDQPSHNWTAAALAQQVGWSPSHLQQRFAAVAGVPLRRMRLWARKRGALRAALRGQSLTEAALAAGFSTPSHFSGAFREMFGMAPSRLLARAPRLIDGVDRAAAVRPPAAT